MTEKLCDGKANRFLIFSTNSLNRSPFLYLDREVFRTGHSCCSTFWRFVDRVFAEQWLQNWRWISCCSSEQRTHPLHAMDRVMVHLHWATFVDLTVFEWRNDRGFSDLQEFKLINVDHSILKSSLQLSVAASLLPRIGFLSPRYDSSGRIPYSKRG